MDLATSFTTKPIQVPRRSARKFRLAVRSLMLVGVLVVGVAAALWFTTRPLSLIASPVRRGAVADVVYATGFVEPLRPVEVSARVTAPVTEVFVEEGDRVARGEALARLDAEDQRHTIAQLAADRVNAEQQEARTLALFQQGWIAKSGRDQAVANANSARAAEAAARAKLDQFTIRSGISGVVLRRDVEPGDLATATKTLFQIGDPNALRITATVDERDIPLVRTRTVALMSTEAYPGRVFRGSVYEITPGGDPNQRAFRVRIRPEDRKLPIGLTLEVNIMVSQRQRALLVPASAIRDSSVWIVDGGIAKRVPVEMGIRGSGTTEIKAGLHDGACIVSDPPPKLKNDERVRVKGC